MAIEFVPLPLPASAEPSAFKDFGREVKGLDAGNLTPEQFAEVEEALYKVRVFIYVHKRTLLTCFLVFCIIVQRSLVDA